MKPVIAFIEANRDRFVGELTEFLTIPSISALPQHAGEVRRCAEWTSRALGRAGLQNVRIIDTAGHPLVSALGVDAQRPGRSDRPKPTCPR